MNLVPLAQAFVAATLLIGVIWVLLYVYYCAHYLWSRLHGRKISFKEWYRDKDPWSPRDD